MQNAGHLRLLCHTSEMQVRKYRWSKVYESSEEELQDVLARRNITARRWTAADGDEVAPLRYGYNMQLWCAEGLLACTVNGRAYSLQPGDVLDLPADTLCDVRVGFGGCVCYESAAARPGPSAAS